MKVSSTAILAAFATSALAAPVPGNPSTPVTPPPNGQMLNPFQQMANQPATAHPVQQQGLNRQLPNMETTLVGPAPWQQNILDQQAAARAAQPNTFQRAMTGAGNLLSNAVNPITSRLQGTNWVHREAPGLNQYTGGMLEGQRADFFREFAARPFPKPPHL